MDNKNKYILHQAVLTSDVEKVQSLIKDNIELNNLDDLGHSALHWAVFRGDIEIVGLLLKAGADPNVFANDGVTPRWRANDFGLSEIEDLLISFGGHIDTNDKFDNTSFKIFNKILGLGLPKKSKEKGGKNNCK